RGNQERMDPHGAVDFPLRRAENQDQSAIDSSGKKNVPRKMPTVQMLNEPNCVPPSLITQSGTMSSVSVADSGTTRTERWRTSFMASMSFKKSHTSAYGKEVSMKNRLRESSAMRRKGRARLLRSL